ncbi:hypothetical protein HZU73_04908 [Apis mellifera caucasica]|nr:hypothetical protein HZU73_04908 [Apis mellifera caucasica]
MRTLVILLSSFLFHWEAVSRGIPSETPRQGGEGEERLGIAGEERILDEVGGGGTSLVDDGRQKSRPTRDGLTRREIGSVEEAWSGTDWGGSHLPRFAEDRQELDRKERNLSPLISLLESNLKETELKKHRDRRSLISDTHGDEEIRKILMNAREKLSDLKSRNTIDDDWIFFVLPSRSGTLTESLFRPAGNGFKIGAQSWRQNEKWLDDKEFLNANKFDYNERNLKKYEESPLSDWNIDGRNKYSGEPAEISWTGEGRSDEKNGGTNFALTKGGRNRSNKQRLIKNDAHRNGDEDYRGIKVNVDVKNGETYGDISIDNTMGNVVGSDKLSAAEISVKIPEARYNKAIRNKRPSSDNKSRFVSDPFVFLTEFEGGTRREEKNKGSTPRESNVIKVHQSPPGGKLIEKKVEEKPYRDSKYSFPIIVGKHLDAKFSNDESRTNKNGGERARMDDELSWIEKEEAKLKQGEKNSGELQVLQLLKELSNIREQIERNQNLYGGNERNHGSSPSRVERIDARNGIRVEYDKQKSAAETSIPLDVNKRGGVKHGERVEEKSTSKIDENVDGERKKEKKGVHRDELQKETVKKRDDYDSDENVKWTSLKGKQKVIDDVNKDKDKLEKKTFEKGNSEVRKSQQIGINNKTNLSKIKFNVENLEEKDNHERKKQDSKIENENFQEKLKEKFDTENLKKIIFGVKIPKIKGIEDSNINSEDFRLENLNWIEYKGENLDTEDNEGNLRKENEIRKNIDNNINGQKYGSNNLKEGKRKKFKIQEQRGQNILVDTKKEYKSDDIKDEKISAKKEEREKYDNTKVKETGIGIKTPQDEKLNTEPLKNKGLEINIPKIEVNDVKKDDNTLLLDKPKWADINADNLETKKIEDTVEKDKWNGIDKLKNNIEVHNGKKYELDDTKDEKISAKEDEKYDDSRVKETSTAIKTPQGEELKTENLKNKGLEINTPKIEVNDVKKDDNKLLIDKPRWTDINADNLKTTKIEDTTVKDNWKGIDDLKNVEIDNGKKYKLNDIKKEKLNAKKEDKEKYDNTKVKDIGIENKIPQDEKFKTETLKNKGLEINIPKTEVKDVKKDDNKLLIDKPQWTDINADNLKTAKIEDTVEKDKWKGIDELKKNVEVDNGKKYELDNTKAEKISAKEEEKYDNSKVKETSTAIKTPQDEELKTETLKNKGLEINTPKIEVKDNNKFLLEKPKWADISLDNLKTTKIEDSIEKDQWKEIDELKKNTIVDNGKKFELDNTKNKKISAKEDEKYDNSKVKETSTEIKNPQDEKLNIENLKNKGLEINIPKIEVEDVKKDDNKLLIDKPQWTDINADNLKTAKIEDTVEKDKWKGIDELKKNVEVDNAKELGVTEDEKINKEEEKKYDNSKVKETSIEIKTPQDEKLKTETLKNKGLEINTPKIEVNDVKKDDNTLLLDKPKWADINADNLKTAKIEDTVEKDKWKGIDELKKNVEVDNAKESGVTEDEKINKEEEEKYDNSKVKETSIEIKTPQDEKLKTETLKNKGLEINTPKIEVNDVKEDDNKLLIDKPQWTDINADNLQTTKIGDTIKKDKWKGIDELKKNVEVDNGKKYELDDRKEEKINAKVEEKYDNLRVKETGTAIKTPQDEELKTETLENKGLEIDIPKIEVKDVKKDDSKLLVDKAKWTNINAGNLKTAKIEDIEKDIEKDKWKGIDELEKNTVDENEKKYELDDTRDEKINAKEEQKYDDSRVKETSTAIKTPQDEEHKTETLENKRLEINIPKTEVKDVKKEDSKLLVDKPKWTDINADNLKTAKIEDSVEKDKWKGIDDLKKNVEVDNGKKYELDDTKDKKINAKEEEKYDDSRLKETSTAIKIPQDEELKTETLENKGLEINIPKTEVKDIKKDDNKLLVDKPKWTDINADNLKTAKIEDTVEKDGRKWKRIDKLKENVEVDNGKKYELDDTKDEKISAKEDEKYDNSIVKETSTGIKTPQDEKLNIENLKDKGLEINIPKTEVEDVKKDDNKLLIDKPQWTDINADNLKTAKIEDTIEKDKWKGIDELKKNVEVDNGKKYELDDRKEEKINAKEEEKYDDSRMKETNTAIKTPQDEELKTETLENKGLEINIPKTEVTDVKKDNSKGLEINIPKTEVEDVKKDDNKLLVDKPKWTNINADNLKTAKIEDTIEKDKWKGIDELDKDTVAKNGKKYELDDIKNEIISPKEEDKEKYDNTKVKETSIEIKTPQDEKLKTETLKDKGFEINIPKIEVEDVKKDDNKLLIDKPQWTDINADNLKTAKIEDTLENDKWKKNDELKKNVEVDNGKEHELNDIKNEKGENKEKFDNSKVKETSIAIKTPQDQKFGTENLKNKKLDIVHSRIDKFGDINVDNIKFQKGKWTDYNVDNLNWKESNSLEKYEWKELINRIDELIRDIEVYNAKKYNLNNINDKKIGTLNRSKEKYDISNIKDTSIETKIPKEQKIPIKRLEEDKYKIINPEIVKLGDIKIDDNKFQVGKWTDYNIDNLKLKENNNKEILEENKWKRFNDLRKKNTEIENKKKNKSNDIRDEKISTTNKDIERYDSKNSKVKETDVEAKTPHEKKLDREEYVKENKLKADDVFRPKLKNVVEKESKMKDNNGKEYISNTDNEKLEDENTSEKEFQLQKLNKGNKLKSKNLKEEKNDRKISVEEDLETKKSKIEDTKKDKFSLQNKIGKVIQENDKFKAEDLKVKEIGLKNSREEYILKDKESGSVNLKNGKNQLLVIEKFKPHLDNNVLWTSKKNDKNSVQSVVNDSKKKDIISYNDKISLKERNESSEKDKKIDDEYEKGTKKYGINENFDSSVNIRNDKNLKKDFWNKDTAYKKEDLYVTRDNALENSNKRNKSGKQDYEVISYKKPLNENEEHEIFENKSRNNNEKLISNEEEVIYKDGNADKISQYENKLKEDLKIEENDENRIKQTGPSFVKEEINETGNIRKKGNEKFDKEILKSSEVENDSLKNDDKKDLKLERTFDKNTLTTEENNVLIRGEELQTVPILSEKTKIAKKEETFGNAETNKKDSVLSEKTKLEDKKSLNEFEIHEDKNKELENNDIDVARATEFNKLSKYKNNDTIKTANIESNRVSNDIVVNSRQTDSADEINKKLGKNGKESSTIQFENLNRTMDSLDITIAGEGNLRNSKGNEELSTAAHVAKLDENKALRSSEDDTSEVETSTGIKSNSDTSAIVNRTADKGQIEIRGSSVNLSELSDIDVHPPEHSDTLGKKDNPSLVSRTVSVDDNEIDGNKIPRYEGSSNVDTRKGSEESKKETESTKKESENVLLLNDSKKNGEESKKEKKIGIQSVKESSLKAQETASNLSKESDFDNKFDAKPTDSIIDIQTDTKDVKKADDKLYTSREEEANAENTREKYHTKPRILESSELNSNILPKILIGNRRKEPDLVEKLKTTSNDDVNLKQTTVSSSTRGSKFPDNNGASRERNISSNAINQAAEEELEKKKITWRNAAVDHPSEENDSKMINLSFTNIDKNEMREAKKGGTSSVITDEKSRTDDTRTTFSNVVDLIEKNSKELENYNNDRSINKIDKYGTNDSRDRFEEIGSKIDSSSLRDLKQERVTRKDKLNDSKNVEKIEEEGVRNESESITGDLNKKEVFKEGSDGGIQVTESNDVTGESEDSSSAPKDEVSLSDLSVKSFGKNDKLEKKQRGTLDLSIKDEGKSEDGDEIIGSSGMRGSNKYKTPSTTRQLIEDNELEQFLPTSIQTALNTKTTSQVYPSDVDENPITSRLPEDITAYAFNWADNERYKELPNKVVAPIPEKIRDNTQIYDSSASRSPKLETGNKLSKLGKQTDEKIENAKENDEKGEKIDASNVTKLKNVEEEKVKSKNILNEYNDKNNKNVNEIGSLKESKISDIENNKREEKKSLNENDKLKVQEKNENIEINNKDLTNNYDENLKSKILTDVNVAEDRDNLLKNDKLIGHKDIPEKEEKNSVLKFLLNEEKIKGSEDKVKKLLIDDNNNNDKRDESIGTRIKIIPEKLNKKQNKETFKTKLNGESKNYEDKLLSAKYRIAKPNENLDEILDDERETQIQKTLTESEIAITELPLLKQNKEENIIEEKEKTNFKVEEERTPNENQPYKTIYNTDNETIENQKGYNIVSNQLNSTVRDLNLKNKNEILKEHEIQDKFNSNIARNILIKPYHISTVDKNDFTNSALSDSNKKIYESKIEDQLINDQMNLKKTADSDSSIKSTHISDAIKNGLILDNSKNTIHESNIKKALNFNVKDDASNVLIKSTDVPNVAKNKLHDEYKNSILSDSKKIIHGSKAENESKFNIKDNNIFKLDSTSAAINNNLNIKNENSVLNHPKQVNYESNVKDQSKFDLKKDIKSDTSVKSASINDLNTGYNDSKDSKILILKSKIPKLESKLDLKKNIGSDTSVKPIPKLLDQHWTNILFDQPSPTNKIAINNPSKIPSIPSLGNAHFSLDEKERNLKSSGLLSHISQKTPSNEISVEIPNVKFVKKLQPSFWKLAKPQTEIVNKNEQPILVSLSEFKSHPDEKDSDRSMKFSSYTPPSKVSGVESKNDDLYTVLKSLSLFTHFQDDSKDKKVPTTYDDRVSTSEDAPKVGSVERTNDKSSSISQESDREKLDVYIVKQASEGPVKIAHIENTKPLVVTNEEISRSSYEKVVDILEKNGIKTDISTAKINAICHE